MHWLILHWITVVVLLITTIVIYMAIKSINSHRTIYEMIAVMAATKEELMVLSREDLMNLYNRVRKLSPPFIFKDRVIFQVGMISVFKKLEDAIELKKKNGSM
jgi:hypothetical protein